MYYLPHDLLIEKLEVCGLDKYSLNLLLDCLSIRKQRTKVGSRHFINKFGPLLINDHI